MVDRRVRHVASEGPKRRTAPAAAGGADAGPYAGDPNFMTSLERGLRVICAFSEHRRSLTISQVSQSTGLSRSAARRCLYTLRALGYAAEVDARFSLRPKVLALGHAYLSSTPLATVAQPFLDEVSTALGESCSAAILDGDDIVYICRSAEKRILSINLTVGARLPAYCTSMGQVLLADLEAPELETYLSGARMVARTNRTTTSAAALRKQLLDVRRNGFACLDQELEAGLCSIAVPVTGVGGRVVAAINVSTHATRVAARDMPSRFLRKLQACARAIGAALPSV